MPSVTLVNVTASKEKIYVLPGDSTLLECTVYFLSNLNQVLTSSFVWTYNGQRITSGVRRYVYPNGSLQLSDAGEDIAGNYICNGRLNYEKDTGEASDTIHVVIASALCVLVVCVCVFMCISMYFACVICVFVYYVCDCVCFGMLLWV